MPPKKQTKNGEEADTGGTILSDVEIQLLAAVCTHAPKNIWTANWSVDWQKVTDTLGATNIRATKERFRSMAAKHDFFTLEPVEGGDPKATPAKAAKAPKTPRSRKKKADTEGEALEESPTKKAKTEDTTQLVDQNGDMNEVEGQNNGAKENEGWGVLTLPTDEL